MISLLFTEAKDVWVGVNVSCIPSLLHHFNPLAAHFISKRCKSFELHLPREIQLLQPHSYFFSGRKINPSIYGIFLTYSNTSPPALCSFCQRIKLVIGLCSWFSNQLRLIKITDTNFLQDCPGWNQQPKTNIGQTNFGCGEGRPLQTNRMICKNFGSAFRLSNCKVGLFGLANIKISVFSPYLRRPNKSNKKM